MCRRRKAVRAKRFPPGNETALKQAVFSSSGPPGCSGLSRDWPRMQNRRKEKAVSTVALSRTPSRTTQGIRAFGSLGYSIWTLIIRSIQANRDERVLQMLPDNVLADMGLEKMEIMAGSDGQRHVWVIPHRYH
jgi:hypothetical protein